MKIITTTGYKGGVAKTTTAIHLAEYFSDFGRTILIDHDPNKSAVKWYERTEGLKFEVVDDKFPVKKTVGCDYILFDLPANPDSEDIKAIARDADLLILPTAPTRISYEPLFDMLSLIDASKARILITLVPRAPNKSGSETLQEMQEEGMPVFETLIRQSTGYDNAHKAGKTIRHAPDLNQRLFWDDYRMIGEQIRGAIK
jgi:chromosome partitioning protein